MSDLVLPVLLVVGFVYVLLFKPLPSRSEDILTLLFVGLLAVLTIVSFFRHR